MYVIESMEQLATAQKERNSADFVGQWSHLNTNLFNITVSQISEFWQERIYKQNLQSLTIIDETLEFMVIPLLDDKLNFVKYKRTLQKYLDAIPSLDNDEIFELSVKTLIEIGYDV